jgi:uncharacterized protein YndB with AHSA1/START domain
MIDIVKELAAIQRRTGPAAVNGRDCRTVTLSRTYDAEIADVWDCLTNPDRLPRWFAPVKGDFKVGGSYQIEGNAGGEIRRCEPPRLLNITWIFGPVADGDVNEVEVRLAAVADGQTVLELEHVATVPPQRWDEYGPGAVGVGWDLTLLGLGLHLATGEEAPEHSEEWAVSAEGAAFATGSSEAWRVANEASGASPEAARTAAENTTRFYAPGA